MKKILTLALLTLSFASFAQADKTNSEEQKIDPREIAQVKFHESEEVFQGYTCEVWRWEGTYLQHEHSHSEKCSEELSNSYNGTKKRKKYVLKELKHYARKVEVNILFKNGEELNLTKAQGRTTGGYDGDENFSNEHKNTVEFIQQSMKLAENNYFNQHNLCYRMILVHDNTKADLNLKQDRRRFECKSIDQSLLEYKEDK